MQALEAVFEFLFKYRPYVFEKGQLVMGPPWPTAAVLLVVAALAAGTYTVVRGASRKRDRIVLALLRTSALALLALCLSRPALLLATVVPQQSFLGVLVDDSRSMRVADDGRPRSDFVGKELGADAPLMKALSGRYKVRLFRFSDSADRLDSVSSLTFEGYRTSLPRALEHAGNELLSVPLAGLVLVTDGADNGEGEGAVDDLLPRLRARSVPVFTVGLGRERFARDVELTKVDMPSSVLKGTSVTAQVRVAQRGLGGTRVQLHVEDAGRRLQSQELTLPPDGESAVARVHLTTSEAGARRLRFRIEPQPGEPIAENNQQDVAVQVLDRREKILYLEGEPRFELKFIRRAVADDRNLQVVCLQRTSQNKFLRLDVDDAEELAGGFPRTREELFKYRGLVLGSVEAGFFTADQLRMIAEFVGQRGGGLLTLGGRHSFAEGGYGPTPLAEVLPVVLEEPVAGEEPFFAEMKVEPTPHGMTHGVTQLAATEELSAQRWSHLPPLSTVNPIRRTKPGAVSLLVGRGEALGGPQVVLAHQRYGAGKSLAFTAGDSWMWQMHADMALEDMTHENLWRQLLRWLVSDVPGTVTASVSPDRAPPGSPVTISAVVTDETHIKVNDAEVAAYVTDPAGDQREVPLEWSVGKDGEYTARFSPRVKGAHAVRVGARRQGRVLGEDVAQLQAADVDTEYYAAEMRRPLLERISEETGGRFYTASTVSSLPEDIRYSGGGATIQEQKPLWDMPALFLGVVGLLCAEWVYRKRRGLA
ncbi:MAG TPA: hypothetical protein VMR21_04995 [Vicinamibacteria bacterium]|nr:hypothetical protein [Vicinamibacteria bacterium]